LAGVIGEAAGNERIMELVENMIAAEAAAF
jgi:hypothetical protein